MTSMTTKQVNERIVELCGAFKLPTVASEVVPRFQKAGQHQGLPLLLEVLEQEAQDRLERRIERLRRASHLPPGKTFDTLNQTRLCRPLVDQLRALRCGEFLQRAGNVLCFGLPGAGKTHAAAALGHLQAVRGHLQAVRGHLQAVRGHLQAVRGHLLALFSRSVDGGRRFSQPGSQTAVAGDPPGAARGEVARHPKGCDGVRCPPTDRDVSLT